VHSQEVASVGSAVRQWLPWLDQVLLLPFAILCGSAEFPFPGSGATHKQLPVLCMFCCRPRISGDQL
jgi:hypothetical protein